MADLTPEGVTLRMKTLEVVRTEPEGVPLDSTPVVIPGGAGGTGAGSIEGWNEIVELAEIINAGLGSTHPAFDQDWPELETLIGQWGKMVSSMLYVAIGLSGGLQQMVGLRDPKLMISINNDPKSPVFD